MSKGSGVSRGDKRRNARLAELRLLVPRENAIIGIDLAEDNQAVVVTDHDPKVLARRSPRCKAWQLGEVLDWGVARAQARGFASVTVACEPTRSRWMHVQQACAERGLNFVCVQTLVTHNAREAEDYTRDKSDQKDAVLIAWLAAELRCYRPEVIEEDWAVLRCLGQRRDALVTEATRCRQQITDRLALAWPAVLGAAAAPLESVTFLACLQVVAERCDGDPGTLRRYGLAEFTQIVRGVLPAWGGQRICHRIVACFHAVLGDSRGAVPARRRGALKLAGHALADLRRARQLRAGAEAEMIAQLHVLGIADVLASIDGLATSSTRARAWRRGGTRLHHIIAPGTGLPAGSCWRTASVAAATCVDANTASTAAILRGERAPQWLDELHLPARLVRHDGTAIIVGGWPAGPAEPGSEA